MYFVHKNKHVFFNYIRQNMFYEFILMILNTKFGKFSNELLCTYIIYMQKVWLLDCIELFMLLPMWNGGYHQTGLYNLYNKRVKQSTIYPCYNWLTNYLLGFINNLYWWSTQGTILIADINCDCTILYCTSIILFEFIRITIT